MHLRCGIAATATARDLQFGSLRPPKARQWPLPSDPPSQPTCDVGKHEPCPSEGACTASPGCFLLNRLTAHSGATALVMDWNKPSALDDQPDASDADAEAFSRIELTHPVMVGDDRDRATQRPGIAVILALNSLLRPPAAVLRHALIMADTPAPMGRSNRPQRGVLSRAREDRADGREGVAPGRDHG